MDRRWIALGIGRDREDRFHLGISLLRREIVISGFLPLSEPRSVKSDLYFSYFTRLKYILGRPTSQCASSGSK
jgi:hypothetical protein